MTTRTVIAAGALVAALVLVVFVFVVVRLVRGPAPQIVESAEANPPATAAAPHPGFLYGRITTIDDDTYEGRLRWGGDQEAFWNDYFNGVRDENPWAVHAPFAQSRKKRSIEIFGLKIGDEDSDPLRRSFMVRFGDIARIETRFQQVRVTLKSGSVVTLDRFSAGDIDDGVRVWDARRGVVDLDTKRIRAIEFLPTPPAISAPARLHGTVRTRQGDFTGFILWDRQDCLVADVLDGRTADRELSLRYETIRSIARQSADTALVTLLDGREMAVSGREVGRGNRGIYVDDGRYGRVLISWDVFERVEFSSGGSGPGYGDFAPGRALEGTVITRDGRVLGGRLIYDFDESETTDTLDAPIPGVDYTILFDLITSIVPHARDAGATLGATVILADGEKLQLERADDLGERNAGLLIFADGRERPDYVPWADIDRIDLDRRQIP